MALAGSQREPRRGYLLWPSRGASLGPRAALPALVLPVAFRRRSGSSQGSAEAGGGGIRRRAPPKGLYELLGVQSNATQAQIKSAYYKQSFLYHPDRNAGSVEATERFTHINQAYLVLGSVSLRKKYDRGLLSQEDISTVKKPFGKDGPAAQAAPKRTQPFMFTQTSGKPIFDFDKFYQAHYGEQLERARAHRLKQQEMQKMKRRLEKEQQDLFSGSFALLLLISSFLILFRVQ